MNICLTGHTGFVGSNLVKFLQKEGYQYKCISRINLFEGNFNLNRERIDILIHLAGKAHDLKKARDPYEYYQVNTELTQMVFDSFLASHAKVFISLSSVKAVADRLDLALTEDFPPNPATHYGKSKLLAEQYILSKSISAGKRVYILRPCMIHGTGNKGNLNILYKIVSRGLPWPFGAFENMRSYCSIDNLCFIINELIKNEQIPSGVYNVADDEPISTNELIKLIAESKGKKEQIWNLPKSIIKTVSHIGDFLNLPLNSERLTKLTETYVVSTSKIRTAINKPLPLTAREGLMKTLNSFNTNAK